MGATRRSRHGQEGRWQAGGDVFSRRACLMGWWASSQELCILSQEWKKWEKRSKNHEHQVLEHPWLSNAPSSAERGCGLLWAVIGSFLIFDSSCAPCTAQGQCSVTHPSPAPAALGARLFPASRYVSKSLKGPWNGNGLLVAAARSPAFLYLFTSWFPSGDSMYPQRPSCV